jgi:myo-inositol 2-dehydrogenase/D-chiro-inositol 1-dehydrogenase
VRDYKTLLRSDADAIVICSSTDTHAKIIEEAAEAGKHIFCEKPVDHDLSKIDRALSAVQKNRVKLQVGFNRRFDPNFKHVRDVVASGGVGDVRIVRITSRDPGPPPIEYIKVSGGIFLDMTIHDFDMARYLTGSEVTQVHAIGRVRVDEKIGAVGDIDTAIITLEFANGAIGTIDNCREAVYGYDQRVEVFGSAGVISAENNTPHRTVLGNKNGMHSALPLNFFMDRYTESYVQEMREFVSSVLNDTVPPVTGSDGRAPVVIGIAAKRSLLEGRPVKVSEVELAHA